MQLWMQVLAEI